MEKIIKERWRKWRNKEIDWDALASSSDDDRIRDKAWRIRTIYYGRYNECSILLDNLLVGIDLITPSTHRARYHFERIQEQEKLVKSLEDGNPIRYCREQQKLMFYKAMFNEYNKIVILSL
jgi:hypothetical protein